jgi:hypothetical protein
MFLLGESPLCPREHPLRFALVPRALAAFAGNLPRSDHSGRDAAARFRYQAVMLMPAALSLLALALWLIAKDSKNLC